MLLAVIDLAEAAAMRELRQSPDIDRLPVREYDLSRFDAPAP
jgi:hypothetical protein